MKDYASISPSAGGNSSGIPGALVSGGCSLGRAADLATSASQTQNHTAAVQLPDVLREAGAKLDQAPETPVSASVCAAHGTDRAIGVGIRASLCNAAGTTATAFRRGYRRSYRQFPEYARSNAASGCQA